MESTEIRPGIHLTHHDWGTCKGERCPLHNPSNHPYRVFPLYWNSDAGIMEREIYPNEFVPDPDDYKVLAGGYLYRNSAKCLDCNDHIISMSRHDFTSCSCGALSVDGGHDYPRRVFDSTSINGWEDTSIYLP